MESKSSRLRPIVDLSPVKPSWHFPSSRWRQVTLVLACIRKRDIKIPWFRKMKISRTNSSKLRPYLQIPLNGMVFLFSALHWYLCWFQQRPTSWVSASFHYLDNHQFVEEHHHLQLGKVRPRAKTLDSIPINVIGYHPGEDLPIILLGY